MTMPNRYTMAQRECLECREGCHRARSPSVEDAVSRTWSALGRFCRLARKGRCCDVVDSIDNCRAGATAGQRRRDTFPLPLFLDLADYGLTEVLQGMCQVHQAHGFHLFKGVHEIAKRLCNLWYPRGLSEINENDHRA